MSYKFPSFRPTHVRMVAFLQKELARQATVNFNNLNETGLDSGDARIREVRSYFGSKFKRSLELELNRMIDLYGWQEVAKYVHIDFGERLLELAMADEIVFIEQQSERLCQI